VEDYEPPTIDTRQEDLEASVPKSKKRNMKFRIEADDIGREV
jgi:hypothetical protein